MNSGLLKVILYYAIGFALAGLSYLIVGQTYFHAPAQYHWIILLTFLGGFFWLIGALGKHFFGTRSQNLKWIIIVNLSMCLGLTLLLIWPENSSEAELEPDQIIIEESGDTTTIYNRGNIVLYKVKDSVLIDFMDSSKIDWSKTVVKKK